MDAGWLRARLVARLQQEQTIRSAAVAEAFLKVPRERFLPGVPVERAYHDIAVPVKVVGDVLVSSASQPTMIALMLEALGLRPGLRVLEIGAGTGYNAALIAAIVGDPALVTTIEIDGDVAAQALANLEATGFNGVEVVCADGALGYPPNAPYDRIVVTAGAHEVSRHWLEQLRPDGRLEVPLWVRAVQIAATFARDPAGHLVSRSLAPCAFVELRREAGSHQTQLVLDSPTGLVIAHEDADRVPAEAVQTLLAGPRLCVRTGEPGLPGLELFLAASDERTVAVSTGDAYGCGLGQQGGFGLLDPWLGSAALARRDRSGVFVVYGGDEAGHDFSRLFKAWRALGQPGVDRLRLEVCLAEPAPGPGRVVVPRDAGRTGGPTSWLVFDYRAEEAPA